MGSQSTEEVKQKKRERNRKWRETHREEKRAEGRRYYAKHRAERLAQQKAYRAANGEKVRAKNSRWKLRNAEKVRMQWQEAYRRNPERAHARSRKWKHANRAKLRLAARRYYAKNAALVCCWVRKRQALKNAAPVVDLSTAQWQEIRAAYGYRCVYCGRKTQRLTMDHITPLSKGGSHTVSNIVPACKSCNSRKYTGPVLVPVQPLLLTIAPLAAD